MFSHGYLVVFISAITRLQTSAWPRAKHGADSQRKSPAGKVRRAAQLEWEGPARWATWLLSTWRASIQPPLRNQMSTALLSWFGSSSQGKSHMQVSCSAETCSSPPNKVHRISINVSKFPCSDARSEDQICQCVRNGDRPAEDLIPGDIPPEITELMKKCWDHNPLQRPTFKGVHLCILCLRLKDRVWRRSVE